VYEYGVLKLPDHGSVVLVNVPCGVLHHKAIADTEATSHVKSCAHQELCCRCASRYVFVLTREVQRSPIFEDELQYSSKYPYSLNKGHSNLIAVR